MARAVNLEVKLPSHVRPTDETTEQLIKKFLRECSKESIVQYMYENSAWTRRFSKKSVVERQKRLKYKRTAKKNQQELNNETAESPKKKKKQYVNKQAPVNKQ
jgi:lysyl-tRNA synthetase class II